MTKKKLSEFDSLWEWTKTKSNYHFDDFRTDEPGFGFKVIETFPVTWAHHIQTIRDACTPKTWNNLTRTGGSHGHRVLGIDKRKSDIAQGLGDIDEIELSSVYEAFNEMPELKAIIDSFHLEKPQARCHVQCTGQMFTLHIDPIQRMFYDHSRDGAVHDPDPDLDDYGYDVKDIIRITVMLEDWKPGQFLMYGNTLYQQWRAGEAHIHDWINMPHSSANASQHTRISLQVTGLRTALTPSAYDVRTFKANQ